MEDQILTKVIPAFLIAFISLVGKLVYSLLTKDGERLKIKAASVDFIYKVLNEKKWKEKENRIIIEEAFELLYRKPIIYDEIKILLYADKPSLAFKTYLNYRPALTFNSNKKKFKFKDGKRPYWLLGNTGYRLPKSFIKGTMHYIVFSTIATLFATFIANNPPGSLAELPPGSLAELPPGSLAALITAWILDALFWLIAIIFFLSGMKYQDSENDIIRDLGDVFEIDE